MKPVSVLPHNTDACIYSQLHEDGYTQQALQLEVSTIHSSGAVKASDKLSRLFSSCLSSVTEATAHFNSNKGNFVWNSLEHLQIYGTYLFWMDLLQQRQTCTSAIVNRSALFELVATKYFLIP